MMTLDQVYKTYPGVILDFFRVSDSPVMYVPPVKPKGRFYSQFDPGSDIYKLCDECRYCEAHKCTCVGESSSPCDISKVLCCGHPRLRDDLLPKYIEMNLDIIDTLLNEFVISSDDDYNRSKLQHKRCWMSKDGEFCKKCGAKSCIGKYVRKENPAMTIGQQLKANVDNYVKSDEYRTAIIHVLAEMQTKLIDLSKKGIASATLSGNNRANLLNLYRLSPTEFKKVFIQENLYFTISEDSTLRIFWDKDNPTEKDFKDNRK